jgi:O-antigen ligase
LRIVERRSDRLRAGALGLSRAAVLAALVMLGWRRAWRFELPGLDVPAVPFHHLGRTIRAAEVLVVLAALFFVLAGPPTISGLRRGALGAFAASALALACLAGASSFWALHPGLAVLHGVHLMIWAAFALVVAGARVAPDRMGAAFVLGLLVHAVIGLAQMVTQKYLGLTLLGELRVRPEAPWSTVTEGAATFLRAHGLSPNPNVLAGHLAVGLILCWGLAAGRRPAGRGLVAVAWAALFTTLLFTFSRSGLLAAILGMALAAVWQSRVGVLAGSIAGLGRGLAVIGTIVLAVFAWNFHGFLADRIPSIGTLLGPYAATDRRGLMDVAMRLLADHPLGGVGDGNFSAATRAVTPGATVLDSVHNVPLLIGAELGLAGLALVGTIVAALAIIGYRRWRARMARLWHGPVAGSLTALAVVSLLDHYPWSIPQGGLLGAWLVGWWLTEDSRDPPAA